MSESEGNSTLLPPRLILIDSNIWGLDVIDGDRDKTKTMCYFTRYQFVYML